MYWHSQGGFWGLKTPIGCLTEKFFHCISHLFYVVLGVETLLAARAQNFDKASRGDDLFCLSALLGKDEDHTRSMTFFLVANIFRSWKLKIINHNALMEILAMPLMLYIETF